MTTTSRKVMLWAVWCLMRPFFRFRVEGRENIPASNALFAANHTSLADSVLLWLATGRDLGFLATAGLYRIPILRWVLRLARCIPVDRHAFGRQGAHDGMFGAIEQAYNFERDLGVFPQGGIVTDINEPISIKRGIEKMVEIGYITVPTTLRGARGSFPWLRRVKITFHPVYYGVAGLRDHLAALYKNP